MFKAVSHERENSGEHEEEIRGVVVYSYQRIIVDKSF